MCLSEVHSMVSGGSCVKIGAVADVHQGPLDIRKWLRKFIEDMNSDFNPDIVVELGDFIGCKKPEALKALKEINEVYSQCKAPRYYVFGNHDLDAFTREEYTSIIGINYWWKSIDVKFLHIIFLDAAWGPNTNSGGPTGHIPSQELDWLQGDLEKVPRNKPIVVFCHYPIAIFCNEPRIDNEDELLELFRDYRLVATFSGDAHYGGYREENGTHHICLHSMGWWELDKITGSYARITVTPNKIVVEGRGAQPSYILKIKR